MLSTKFQDKRKATSMKQMYRTSSGSNLKKNSTLSLKRSFNGPVNLFVDFQAEKSRRSAPSLDDAEAMLDAQIERIRGDLESMKMEHRTMAARVLEVRSRLDSVTSSSSSTCSSRNNSTNSLEMIAESSIVTLVEDDFPELNGKNSSSTSSLNFSKRDSGYVFDPVFETDNRHICIPNNTPSPVHSLNTFKKARSTTALDFIRNNLHEDASDRLKATSCDRISCYSDSALLCTRAKHLV